MLVVPEMMLKMSDNPFRMVTHYWDMETTGVHPESCQILTIQYQQLDPHDGSPHGPLTILRSWESSEAEILLHFLDYVFATPDDQWRFVPMGFNLMYDLTVLWHRARTVLNRSLDLTWLFYRQPMLDLKHLAVILNRGCFKGASNSWLTGKPSNGAEVPQWAQQGHYDLIEKYIREEAACDIAFYQAVLSTLSSLRNTLRQQIRPTHRWYI